MGLNNQSNHSRCRYSYLLLNIIILIACGGIGVANAKITADVQMPPTHSPPSKFVYPMVVVKPDKSLQYIPHAPGIKLAACSIGEVWGGDKNKQCKKNNKKRIAEMFCRDAGGNNTGAWLDSPASKTMPKPKSVGAVTWHVGLGQSWGQGKWIISKESPLVWDNITCATRVSNSVKSNAWLSNIKYSGLNRSGGVPVQACFQANKRCNTHSQKMLADEICKGAGFTKGSVEVDVNEPIADMPFSGGPSAVYSPTKRRWEVLPSSGRVVSKVGCKLR